MTFCKVMPKKFRNALDTESKVALASAKRLLRCTNAFYTSHAIENTYSQSEYRDVVEHSAVIHRTFPSRTTRMSH